MSFGASEAHQRIGGALKSKLEICQTNGVTVRHLAPLINRWYKFPSIRSGIERDARSCQWYSIFDPKWVLQEWSEKEEIRKRKREHFLGSNSLVLLKKEIGILKGKVMNRKRKKSSSGQAKYSNEDVMDNSTPSTNLNGESNACILKNETKKESRIWY